MAMARLSATRVSRWCFDAAELTNCKLLSVKQPPAVRWRPHLRSEEALSRFRRPASAMSCSQPGRPAPYRCRMNLVSASMKALGHVEAA
jgi:hypothetical protein